MRIGGVSVLDRGAILCKIEERDGPKTIGSFSLLTDLTVLGVI